MAKLDEVLDASKTMINYGNRPSQDPLDNKSD